MDERTTLAMQMVERVVLPASKEELINTVLVENATGSVIELFERLPRDRYDSQELLSSDLRELSQVHSDEVSGAKTFNDFLSAVLLHAGDVQHISKDAFNAIVDRVIGIAERDGDVDKKDGEEMRHRLYATYVDLRKGMTEVYNDAAPINPNEDLPKFEAGE